MTAGLSAFAVLAGLFLMRLAIAGLFAIDWHKYAPAMGFMGYVALFGLVRLAICLFGGA